MKRILYFILLSVCMGGNALLMSCSDDEEEAISTPDRVEEAENYILKYYHDYLGISQSEGTFTAGKFIDIKRPLVIMRSNSSLPTFLDMNSITKFDAPDSHQYVYDAMWCVVGGDAPYSRKWDEEKVKVLREVAFATGLPDFVRVYPNVEGVYQPLRKVEGIKSDRYLLIGAPLDPSIEFAEGRVDSIDLYKVAVLEMIDTNRMTQTERDLLKKSKYYAQAACCRLYLR